jgi:alpha/beta superfamily hydrolase
VVGAGRMSEDATGQSPVWVTGAGGAASDVLSHPDGHGRQVRYVSTPAGRIFVVVHTPAVPADAAMVICQPLYAEAARSHQLEVELADLLAAREVAAIRFHYLGAGQSEGDAIPLDFRHLVRDTRAVVEYVADALGIARVGLVGTRIGAFVAAAAAAGTPDAPLVMWEPPADLDRYFDELFRARMIGLLKRGERDPNGTSVADVFARDGFLDVLGSPVAYQLRESLAGISLAELVEAAAPRPMMVAQMSVRPDLRPGLAAALERWDDAGIPLRHTVVDYDEAWWFGASGRELVVEATVGGSDVVAPTVAFVRQSFAGGPA